MSASPTRYYASIPTSRSNPRPKSPPSNAEVRSQAIAKLKRAASLPRTPAGRRPAQPQTQPPTPTPATPSDGDRTLVSGNDQGSMEELKNLPEANHQRVSDYDHANGSSSVDVSRSPSETQEILSPSPVSDMYDHTDMYTPSSAGYSLQRSASSGSSFLMPTPPHLTYGQNVNAPYFPSSSPNSTPDWAAMQLAQSYLPSLSPIGNTHSPHGGGIVHGMPSSIGRNTPSPLPTLGELRTLQRSNSAAARAHAMSRLTGGRDTPVSEDDMASLNSSRSTLQRAETVGASRLAELTSRRLRNAPLVTQEAPAAPVSPQKPALGARPRLQRSFTVSSSNMGEERRSAVGRRMVERLAERKAAREQEEREVRELWEERRAAVDQDEAPDHIPQDEIRKQHDDPPSGAETPAEGYETGEDHFEDADSDTIPEVHRHSPDERHRMIRGESDQEEDRLGIPERPVSRGTMQSMRSAEEAFEYESHLRRSLSSRTARGAVGTSAEVVGPMETTSPNVQPAIMEEIEDQSVHQAFDEPLPYPRPAYATPARHTPNASTSTNATAHGNHSPGESIVSRDGLGSMMFIVGRGSTQQNGPISPLEGNWPSEVEEGNGSEWGTPGKVEPSPSREKVDKVMENYASSANYHPTQSTAQLSPTKSPTSPELTPASGNSLRASVMSWEEVGGPDDQAVPSDARYHKKSGSISAKLGRNIRSAMRKRSASRSSQSSLTEGQTSPKTLSIAIQNFSRRGSESSLSPSQSSALRSVIKGSPNLSAGFNDHMRHQPSISSLSPSQVSYPESTANSMLLQHQLASGSAQVSQIPRAVLSDPRVHNSKLSPFPGIVTLERNSPSAEHTLTPPTPEAPRFLHQASDSMVPSLQRVTPAGKGADSIYALPLPVSSPVESRRASDDSLGKRSWLAKAFGQQTSPRSSTGVSRHSSTGVSRQSSVTASSQNSHIRKMSTDSPSSIHHATFASPNPEADPFAGPIGPAAPVALLKPGRHRSASPAISVVPELSEEGSRLTRFTAHTNRFENNSPRIEESEEGMYAEQSDYELDLNSTGSIRERADALLALGPDDPNRPEIFDDPPRKLLLATQVLQVVNMKTAKDRYLFLFNDVLLITKPFITSGFTATLDTRLVVKSVIPLHELHVSGFDDHSARDPPRSESIEMFIHQFSQDPVMACKSLLERSGPLVDTAALARLIFRTQELDKANLGLLLSSNEPLASAFLDQFQLKGVRIDTALRTFLLSMRPPGDLAGMKNLLRIFAQRYFIANQDTTAMSVLTTLDLVSWMMQLNDLFYGMYGFAPVTHGITLETFITSFRTKGTSEAVSSELLTKIFNSIRNSRLDQALTAEKERTSGREVVLSPSTYTLKLEQDQWSEKMMITIPSPDSHMRIRLYGEGLEFDPPVLDFSKSHQAGFRIRGSVLGTKSMLLDRIGPNAPLYASVGQNRAIKIERSFMKHTFQATFTPQQGKPRKFCFSVPDAAAHAKWGQLLQRQISRVTAHKMRVPQSPVDHTRQATEEMSLQVLKDALVMKRTEEEHEKQEVLASRGEHGDKAGNDRKGSVSVTLEPNLHNGQDRAQLPGTTQTGKELVLLCRQNSLLPGILELLHVEPGQVDHSGRSNNRHAFQNGHEEDHTMTHGFGHGNHGQSNGLARPLHHHPVEANVNSSIPTGGQYLGRGLSRRGTGGRL